MSGEEAPAPETKKAKTSITLYSYWRSSCSWRVRIALHLKGLAHEIKPINLLKGEQRDPEFKKINPLGLVPVLEVDGFRLTQSMAMLEYLEEAFPSCGPRLLPADPQERAVVRSLAETIASGIQPIQNLQVLVKVAKDHGDEHKIPWGKHWITEGLTAFEAMLVPTAGKFCYKDSVTLADLCLVPQLLNARRFGVDLSAFPTVARIEAACNDLEAFKKAAPDAQPDAVPA